MTGFMKFGLNQGIKKKKDLRILDDIGTDSDDMTDEILKKKL